VRIATEKKGRLLALLSQGRHEKPR